MKQPARYAPYLYILLLLPCLAYTVFYTARAIGQDYITIPFWDAWRCVEYVEQLLRFDLRHFWVQHNDHRIVFPEMLFALDYIFLRGRQWLPIACNIACQFVQLGLLWWLLSRLKEIPAPFRVAFAACCGLFMASAIQVQAILTPFLLQWYLSQAAAALAFLFLWLSVRTGRLASLIASIITTVVTTYSTGNGMLIWPVLVAMAMLLRLPRRRIVILSVTGAVSIAVYFAGYSFMGQGRTLIFLGHPFYVIWFVGVFVGTPASYVTTRLGGLIGLMSLAGVIVALAVAKRRGRASDAALTISAGVCLYIVCSAVLMAYGRMDPADPLVSAAKAARYASVPMTYWANLVVVIGWLATAFPAAHREWASHLAAAGLAVVLLVAVMARQTFHERTFASDQARGHEAETALVSGVEDPDLIRVVFPDPPFVLKHMPAIRQRRLSIFAAGRQDWIGQPLSKLFQPGADGLCSGSFDDLAAVIGGYRAEGWALETATNRPPAYLVLAGPSGTIAGLAATRSGGYPPRTTDRTRRPPSDLDWTGFARADRMPASLQAYAIVNGGKTACVLGSPHAIPHAKLMDAAQVGAAIHISEWKTDPAWTRNGFHVSVGTLAGEILYGSYSGADEHQGKLTSAPFETKGCDCIAVPVAHGPSPVGQLVQLQDASTGRTIASIPLSDSGFWRYWAIDPQGAATLAIVAEDRGSQWGQWVAVGEPHWCKQ